MFSGTFYLLSCLATLAAAIYEAPNSPDWTPGIEELCQSLGHVGACKNLNYQQNFELRCSNIYCLGRSKPGLRRPVYYIGPAHDEVQCGMNKICIKGLCMDLAGEAMPKQSPFVPSVSCSMDSIQWR